MASCMPRLLRLGLALHMRLANTSCTWLPTAMRVQQHFVQGVICSPGHVPLADRRMLLLLLRAALHASRRKAMDCCREKVAMAWQQQVCNKRVTRVHPFWLWCRSYIAARMPGSSLATRFWLVLLFR